MSINITVAGRLTKALELQRTKTGRLVTRFDLAHNFRERAGKDFSIDGVWSKRTRDTVNTALTRCGCRRSRPRRVGSLPTRWVNNCYANECSATTKHGAHPRP